MSEITPKIGLKIPAMGSFTQAADIQDSFRKLDELVGALADANTMTGTATDGSTTTLTDDTLAMDTDAMAGGTLIVKRGGTVVRVATVVSNTATVFTVATGAAMQAGDSYTAIPDANTGIANVNNKTHTQLVKDVAGASDVTLTAAENIIGYYKLTGALTANINVIVNTNQRHFTVENGATGAFTITVKTATGTGIAVPQGKSLTLYCDGNNVADNITGKADVNIDNEVVQLPAGAASEVAAGNVDRFLSPDGTWKPVVFTLQSASGYARFAGGLMEQWGSSVLITDSAGNAFVTLPIAHSTWYTEVAYGGDLSNIVIGNVNHASSTMSGFWIHAESGGSPYANAAVRVNFMTKGD